MNYRNMFFVFAGLISVVLHAMDKVEKAEYRPMQYITPNGAVHRVLYHEESSDVHVIQNGKSVHTGREISYIYRDKHANVNNQGDQRNNNKEELSFYPSYLTQQQYFERLIKNNQTYVQAQSFTQKERQELAENMKIT